MTSGLNGSYRESSSEFFLNDVLFPGEVLK